MKRQLEGNSVYERLVKEVGDEGGEDSDGTMLVK